MDAGQVPAGAQQPTGGVSKQPPIKISISDDMEAGVYANAASASVTSNELILDLGYIVPNKQPMTVKVVSRANMSIKTAESLVQLLQGSISDYYKKVKPRTTPVTAIPSEGPGTPPPAMPAPPKPPVVGSS